MTRTTNTEAEVGIEFNSTASQEQIPKADAVAQTLISAATNSSNNFSISIEASSIKVVGEKTHDSKNFQSAYYL